jgi:hypothetical protein
MPYQCSQKSFDAQWAAATAKERRAIERNLRFGGDPHSLRLLAHAKAEATAKGPMVRTWTECEVQGRGRRYWFRSASDAVAFESGRQARGYAAVRSGVTVWVPFGKRITEDVRRQRMGMDPEVW